MAEARQQDRVLYVYDRICPKESKRREILREYGADLKRNNGPTGNSRQNNPGGQRRAPEGNRRPPQQRYGEQRPRPNQNSAGAPRRSAGQAYTGGGNRGYGYSSQTPPPRRQNAAHNDYGRADGLRGSAGYQRSGGYYGAAVKQRPLKLILDGIINFIDSVEERGRNDERIAKSRAIAAKRWSEYKHIIKTVLILLLIVSLFVTLVYNMFFVVKEINVDGTAIYAAEQVVGVSGINMGDTLYSFSAGEASDMISFRCPYIRSAEVDRTIPSKVNITLTDDTAIYCANIWGDWVKLSSGLRVLEVTTMEEAMAENLAVLILPEVNYSVAGGVLGFADAKDERFIRDTLGKVETSQLGRTGFIDRIDLTNEYSIQIEYDSKYIMKFGGEVELGTKLLMAYKTITSDKFEKGTPAKIDLSTVGEASVIYDHSIATN